MIIRIGTRGSKLALAQANYVLDTLKERFPENDYEIVVIKTTGDLDQTRSLDAIGTKGIFTEEIEQALLNDEIQLAVHSMKDMPDSIKEGLIFADPWNREDARDVLVTRKGTDKNDIEIIGTSSLRRRVQIERFLTGGEIRVLRGNVPTRIQKLKDGEFDAIILAAAGESLLLRPERQGKRTMQQSS